MKLYPVAKVKLPGKAEILRKFDGLRRGESMVFSNTGNPFILYHQLLQDRGDIFSWEYLERGPDRWRVKIIKI